MYKVSEGKVTECVSSKFFLQLGNKYTKSESLEESNTELKRFKALFGTTPDVCYIIWTKICDKAPKDFKPVHLLWGLAFLKQYTTEDERCSLFGAGRRTVRKRVWIALELLSNLNVIVWENRKQNAVAGQTAFCSLDYIDLKIKQPTPSSSNWYSKKLGTSGLRYEIGISIQTGHIVWKNSGYACGDSTGIALAREAYTLIVEPGEKTIANNSYRNRQYFILPNLNNQSEHSRIMARHDELNKRLKRFKALKQQFRHGLEKHKAAFSAVINIVQLSLENGEPLKDVDDFTQLDKLEDGKSFSAGEVWIKTEYIDHSYVEAGVCNIKNEPVAQADICNIKTEPVHEVIETECIKSEIECIKSEITLGDYECIAPKYDLPTSQTSQKKVSIGEKTFSCNECSAKFSSKWKVKVHLWKHSGYKPFSCDGCEKAFTTSQHLVKHKRCHSGEKPYACDICGKRFIQQPHVIAHRRKHTGEKPFSCEHCGKKYISDSSLKHHRQSDVCKKCEVCGKAFSTKKDRKVHQRMHTGRRIFACYLCEIVFLQRYSLTRHMLFHTGEKIQPSGGKPCHCDICGKELKYKGSLKRHRKRCTKLSDVKSEHSEREIIGAGDAKCSPPPTPRS